METSPQAITRQANMQIIIFSFVTAISATANTGTIPPQVLCQNSMCNGKGDGNYAYLFDQNYFLQCIDGNAYCHACWPLSLVYVPSCNQCLYNLNDDCITTQEWKPTTTLHCPDLCPSRGPKFSGNIADPDQKGHYVECFEGITFGCVACPGNLEFNEQENSCLYKGRFLTQPRNLLTL